jgi:addiction module HigA family antidote
LPDRGIRNAIITPINGLALELHVPVTRISQIVNERRGITADTALRLARHFGTSADFWMNIQKDYELLLTGTSR